MFDIKLNEPITMSELKEFDEITATQRFNDDWMWTYTINPRIVKITWREGNDYTKKLEVTEVEKVPIAEALKRINDDIVGKCYVTGYKKQTMKGIKTATWGKKSHRDETVYSIQNNVRKMF